LSKIAGILSAIFWQCGRRRRQAISRWNRSSRPKQCLGKTPVPQNAISILQKRSVYAFKAISGSLLTQFPVARICEPSGDNSAARQTADASLDGRERMV
jgi:hypothetical protein